jgi:hypothetical protein
MLCNVTDFAADTGLSQQEIGIEFGVFRGPPE